MFSSTIVSKYSLNGITLNPSSENKSPLLIITVLPSISIFTFDKELALIHINIYTNIKSAKVIYPKDFR